MSTYADQATELVLGDRNASYGTPAEDYAKTAKIWSGLLLPILSRDITPQEAMLMMVGLKLSREVHKHKADNVIDAHGYLLCYEWAVSGKRPVPASAEKQDDMMQLAEDIATGGRLLCSKCNRSKPCLCDNGVD